MSPKEDKLINLAVHESSDPEMLKRNAESKTANNPNSESSDSQPNSGSSEPEFLRHDSDSGIASKPEDFSQEYEEGREKSPQTDFDLPQGDKLAEHQITIANRHAG